MRTRVHADVQRLLERLERRAPPQALLQLGHALALRLQPRGMRVAGALRDAARTERCTAEMLTTQGAGALRSTAPQPPPL